MLDRRRHALDTLRIRGALTINELARELRITRTAAANQVTRLVADGLVKAAGLKATGRRPSVTYALTAQADGAFHQAYETFAVDVLDQVARGGQAQVDRVLRQVGQRWISSDAPAVEKLSGDPRLQRATKLIAARGFMPTLERTDDRRYVLQNHNCPIARVCRAHHEAAGMVQHWIEALVGERVRRTNCIFEGGSACEYAIGAKPGKAIRRAATR